MNVSKRVVKIANASLGFSMVDPYSMDAILAFDLPKTTCSIQDEKCVRPMPCGTTTRNCNVIDDITVFCVVSRCWHSNIVLARYPKFSHFSLDIIHSHITYIIISLCCRSTPHHSWELLSSLYADICSRPQLIFTILKYLDRFFAPFKSQQK